MIGRRFRLAAVSVLLAALPMPSPVAAQGVDCGGLKAQIDALSNNRARSGQYAAALRQQQYELQRTQTYSTSIGCNAGFFDTGPAECDAIASRVERMQENIGQLQQQAQNGGDSDYQRRGLSEQYNIYCTGEAPSQTQMMPVDPDAPPVIDDGNPDAGAHSPPGRVRALCVRHCDGGYFPITEDTSSGSVPQLDQLCKALCPNVEASLYTVAPSGSIEDSVTADGTPYTSLPAAFKFQKTFDATCTCRPPHQSWVEALANAEKMIESRKGDVTVTQQMSDAMVRPGALASAVSAVSAATPIRKAKTARKSKPSAIPPLPGLADQNPAPPSDFSGEDVTQQLRRDAPTL